MDTLVTSGEISTLGMLVRSPRLKSSRPSKNWSSSRRTGNGNILGPSGVKENMASGSVKSVFSV